MCPSHEKARRLCHADTWQTVGSLHDWLPHVPDQSAAHLCLAETGLMLHMSVLAVSQTLELMEP
jgi:hypothetical protein